MNKLGLFVNFWEKNWECDLAKYITKIGDLGYDIVEFQAQALLNMDKARMDELKKLAADKNVELTYSLGLSSQYDVSSADETIRRQGIEYLKQIVERVGYMDGRIISGVSYAGWGCVMPKDDLSGDKRPIVDRSIASMKEIAKTAEGYGVTYCVEVVNRFEGCVLNTAEEAVAYVEQVEAPNVGILLDTYHMNIEENSFSDAIHRAAPYLKGMHFGDNNRRCPGTGHIDFDEIAEALSDIGYKDQIVTELFVQAGGEVARDCFVWRNLEDDVSEASLDQKARDLLKYEQDLLTRHHMA